MELGLRPRISTPRPEVPWAWFCALALVAQIFTLNAVPFQMGGWDKVWHFLAYAALTLLLWIATDGKRPALVVGAVMVLGCGDELRQALVPTRSADILDFAADAAAAVITGGTLLFLQGKRPCAESSPR
jgi:VanZ family protein